MNRPSPYIKRHLIHAAEIPVMAAGNINRMEDVKKLLYAGCAKVVLNFSKAGQHFELLEEGIHDVSAKKKWQSCISVYGRYFTAEPGH